MQCISLRTECVWHCRDFKMLPLKNLAPSFFFFFTTDHDMIQWFHESCRRFCLGQEAERGKKWNFLFLYLIFADLSCLRASFISFMWVVMFWMIQPLENFTSTLIHPGNMVVYIPLFVLFMFYFFPKKQPSYLSQFFDSKLT